MRGKNHVTILLVRERYEYPFLEPPEEGRVQLPGTVGGTQEEDLVRVAGVVRSLHLLQQFGLDPPRILLLTGAPLTTDAVDLVNKDHLFRRITDKPYMILLKKY